MKRPIRVLAVEDSVFFQKALGRLLARNRDIELVGCAGDPYEAREQLLTSPVDVMTLDLELPRMDGITFLKLIMKRKPMPVIVLSSLAAASSEYAADSIAAGAFDVIGKPQSLADRKEFAERLIRTIKLAAASVARSKSSSPPGHAAKTGPVALSSYDPRRVIAFGASTGGTEALTDILTSLPDNLPGIAVVQHLPKGFSSRFAARLNEICAMEVREAKDGDTLHPGLVLIAPGDQHMEIRWNRDHYWVVLHSGPLVEHQRPSADVLFQSLAQSAGAHAVAALLTGMGRDGAAGMKQLHDAGARTIAQDADTCVVYGMPRKAVELGAIDSIAPLRNIPQEILKALEPGVKGAAISSHA